jgi:carboxyl-terminal processing protease
MRLLLLFIFLNSNLLAFAQKNAAEQIFYIKRMVEKYHLQPKPIDDNFSKLLFQDILEELDRAKLFFTQAQVKLLQQYELSLDDDINYQKTNFIKAITPVYKEQINAVIQYIDALSQQASDFTIDEKLAKWTSYAENDAALKTRLRLQLKSAILKALYNYATNSGNEAKLSNKQWVQSQEILIRKKQAEKIKSKLQLLLNPIVGFDEFIVNTFCEKMTAVFDPHTNYFSPIGLKEFDNGLSGGQKLIFGFSIGENTDEQVIIEDLVPGSPAYKCGQLHVDDILQKITLSNNQSIDAQDASVEEVLQFLSVTNGSITITVKKKDESLVTVTLAQEKVASEDGLVRSFLLKDKVNLGYIALPDFYVGTDEFANQGCAADVAKEVIKLKKENIQGLILDLRYNGGGSLEEAIDLAGIFIDDGPLVLSKTTFENKVVALRDHNRGTIYDGPLLVLVNGYSASASEIFAGMMQDYNRAYIVGNKTFGKHIGQLVLPLDSIGDIKTILEKEQIPKYGFVKTTSSQYNKLDGTTLQGKGITPNIALPEIVAITESEAKLPHSLQVGNLIKTVVYKPLPVLNTVELAKASNQRIVQNKDFQTAISDFKLLKAAALQPLQLKLSVYVKEQMQFEKNDTSKLPQLYKADYTSFYKERIKVNGSLLKYDDEIKNYLEQDFYIRESFEIFKNILNIK